MELSQWKISGLKKGVLYYIAPVHQIAFCHNSLIALNLDFLKERDKA